MISSFFFLETESLDYFLKGFFMKKFGISVCAKGV
jgi:hypothetical protein